jgi:hypothetical protein
MTAPQKLAAILDLVGQDPLSKTVTVDADGNRTVTYTAVTPQPLPLEGLPPEQPTCEKLLEATKDTLIRNITLYSPGAVYPKNALVRRGVLDYIALEDTSEEPPHSSWSLIRTNVKGQEGDPGSDSFIQIL